MNKNKAKRKERIFGWTKASHKGAIIYFSRQASDKPIGSLKRRKTCKFNKGVHIFIKIKEKVGEHFFFSYKQYRCENCGKQKYEFQK